MFVGNTDVVHSNLIALLEIILAVMFSGLGKKQMTGGGEMARQGSTMKQKIDNGSYSTL